MRIDNLGSHAPPCPDTPKKRHFIVENAELMGLAFRALYDIEGWGDAPPPLPYPSGRVLGWGVAARRLADPEARFYHAMMMAEAAVLPLCVAHDAQEKDDLIPAIGQILGLDTAVERGWIAGYVVCWEQRRRRFPTLATRLRILTAPGRRSRSRVLGSRLERCCRQFVDAHTDDHG